MAVITNAAPNTQTVTKSNCRALVRDPYVGFVTPWVPAWPAKTNFPYHSPLNTIEPRTP